MVARSLDPAPQTYLSEAKDLYFFSRYWDRGIDWYQAQFKLAPANVPIVGEVCPDYLGVPEAPGRMRATPGPPSQAHGDLARPRRARFLGLSLRPKHGLAAESFRATLASTPLMLEEGHYATLLDRYLDHFDRDCFQVAVFDDLGRPAGLPGRDDRLARHRSSAADAEQTEARLPASKARFLPLAKASQRGAEWVRQHDGARVVGAVKRSRVVQRALYRPLGADRPTISPDDQAYVRDLLEPEVVRVEKTFDIALRQRWGWS